ncbi:MAG: cytochrome c maturation protein CcmE [Solirubrobacteraceae bacterium MAG38_C4-C5]|nr:cytochrome c maturation protein CcmE [Candidatus Siliceabacter maunaloa]
MDPSRKRKIRLGAALSVAVLLAAALVYTSFSASSETRTPSELDTARAGVSYQLTGKVVEDSVERTEQGLDFEVRDREGAAAVPVSYQGVVPDPFREGREVIVTVQRQGGGFVGERDTLITKCPSKFTTDEQPS